MISTQVAARRASDAVRKTTVPDDASLRAWLDELLVGASSNKTTAPNAEFANAQKSERRRRCAAVWRSESLATARKNVVEEVAANRLVLRPELDVRCDQVLRAHVLGLFASIEGPWSASMTTFRDAENSRECCGSASDSLAASRQWSHAKTWATHLFLNSSPNCLP